MDFTVLDKIIHEAKQRNPYFTSEITSFDSINEEHATLLREIVSNLTENEKKGYATEVDFLRGHQRSDIYYYVASQIEVD